MAWTPAELSVLPLLPQIDTGLITSIPDKVQGGALQSIVLAHQLGQQRQFMETMKARIAAENSQNQGISQIAPMQARNTAATLDAALPNIGPAGVLQGIKLQGETQEAQRPVANSDMLDKTYYANTEKNQLTAEAAASRANDQADLDAADLRLKNLVANQNLEINGDQYAQAVADLKLKNMSTEDKIKDFEKDRKLATEHVQLANDLLRANAEYARAHGQALTENAATKAGGVDPEKAIDTYNRAIQRLYNFPANSGKDNPDTGKPETINDYMNRVYPNGVKDESGHGFLWQTKVGTSPQAENAINQIKSLNRKIQFFQEKMDGATTKAADAEVAPAKSNVLAPVDFKPIPMTPGNEELWNWLNNPANKDDKRRPSVLAKLGLPAG